MKELTIEQKAQRYDEALKEAVIAHKDEDRHLKATLERIFPELKESEDEKIRNEIISALKFANHKGVYDKHIAWLEKQGMTNVAQTYSHDYVEIGGVKWATMNVGAKKITDSGLYFQWGDTQGYTAEQVPSEKAFTWHEYKYGKYNKTDGKTVLDSEDDAVTAAWGGNWRMPTKEEFESLYRATTNKWTTIDGVDGRLFTDKTDNSKTLFFPAAGYCGDGDVWNVGSFGCYWSRSLDTDYVCSAWDLLFSGGNVSSDYYNYRYQGYSVRGVFGE